MTPETIRSNKMQRVLHQLYNLKSIERFVIDDAHCVCAWGLDFKESYQRLSILRKNFPRIPLLCLTPTVTVRVQSAVIEILQLEVSNLIVFETSSFNKSNLRYEIKYETPAASMFADIGSTITNKFRD